MKIFKIFGSVKVLYKSTLFPCFKFTNQGFIPVFLILQKTKSSSDNLTD